MKIAVVGATGLVGRKIVELLIKTCSCPQDIVLYASKKSAGKELCIQGEKFIIKELNKRNIQKVDYALFCAGGKVSLKYAKYFIKKGAIVIDNSSAYRRHKKVPLIVPEINFNQVGQAKLIANPNCSSIGASLPLFALMKTYTIKRVVVSTYQAVSGAGQRGIDDYINKTTNKFNYQIAGNLIPQIDYALKNGYTFEEDKMSFELKKILQNRSIKICATCVRVPVVNCHCESLNIELDRVPNLKTIKGLLQNMEGVVLYDDLKDGKEPMPLVVDGKQEIFVGRLRKDTSNKYAINMFICFDNILKGASLNAVQILQKLIKIKK